MKLESGSIAVVTGAGSGIGFALAERFAEAGMHVVLADVDAAALASAADRIRAHGVDTLAVKTDVSDESSVQALAAATIERFGAVHVVCNNAGIGAGAEGPLWEHELNDWRWALEVNLWGVIHGINAFVPVMLEQGDEGHVVNTSSGNGGVAPLHTTPEYAVTKSAVVTLTECLYGQLDAADAPVGASVLFPGPNMLRTGLFESWRNRPDELAKARPRRTPYTTLEQYERLMAEAGAEVQYTPVEEVAGRVVDAVRAGEFWILPPSERTDEQIRARADSMLARANPTYLKETAQ